MGLGVWLNGVNVPWDKFRGLWIAADSLGYDSAWIMDNIVAYVPYDPGIPVFEPYTVLASAAETTSRIRLGTLTTPVMRRHPALLAKMVAVIDHISGGRVEVTLGPGDEERQFLPWGMPWPGAGERVSMLSESIEVMKQLWTQDHSVWEGKYLHLGADGRREEWSLGGELFDCGHNVGPAVLAPKPIQKPHPPIWVGVYVPKTTRVIGIAGRQADGVNVFQGDDAVALQVRDAVRGAAAKAGRDPDVLRWSRNVGISITDKVMDIRESVPAMAARSGLPEKPLGLWFVLERHIAGPAEYCVEQLQKIANSGFDDIILHFAWDPLGCARDADSQLDMMTAVANDVMPHLAAN